MAFSEGYMCAAKMSSSTSRRTRRNGNCSHSSRPRRPSHLAAVPHPWDHHAASKLNQPGPALEPELPCPPTKSTHPPLPRPLDPLPLPLSLALAPPLPLTAVAVAAAGIKPRPRVAKLGRGLPCAGISSSSSESESELLGPLAPASPPPPPSNSAIPNCDALSLSLPLGLPYPPR